MGIRSESMETVGERPAGGRRFKFPKIWGGQRDQAAVPTTDGHQFLRVEEPKEVLTFKQSLEAQQFAKSSQLLIEREEHLFGEIKEAEALKDHKEELDKLADDYRDLEGLVLQTLKHSLSPEEISMEVLTSAVKAIIQEVEQDRQWKKRAEMTRPDWRPSNWKNLHDETLLRLVEQRMENPSTPLAAEVKQSAIQEDVHSMARQLKQDLLLVVRVVKGCYPPELDICNFYARLYHQSLSSKLENLAEFGLDDKDCTFLLRWVNDYYLDILRKPELASEIDAEALGKLLPKMLLEPLEEQYLSKQKDELTTYIRRVLEEAEEKWNKGEEPTREDGCFISTVAYDVIQCIHGMVTVAEKIVGDRQKAQSITWQLKDLMQRFETFQNNIIKQNKPNSMPFIKANLCCIEQFSDVLSKQKDLFLDDVREDCLRILPAMKQSAHAYLLKPLHMVLKPQYRKLGTSGWLNEPVFEKLLVSIKEQLQVLRGSTESCHQELIGQMHQEVTTEFLKRLLKGELKLKDKALQLKAYETVMDNAESLHDLFASMGSKKYWLKEIMIKIAEVLKLQDLSAIQLHVASLATAFPDLSVKHVSALLKLKTNLSRGDRKKVKETLTVTLSETIFNDTQPFFITVQVK